MSWMSLMFKKTLRVKKKKKSAKHKKWNWCDLWKNISVGFTFYEAHLTKIPYFSRKKVSHRQRKQKKDKMLNLFTDHVVWEWTTSFSFYRFRKNKINFINLIIDIDEGFHRVYLNHTTITLWSENHQKPGKKNKIDVWFCFKVQGQNKWIPSIINNNNGLCD